MLKRGNRPEACGETCDRRRFLHAMRYDDRLATVLRIKPSSAAVARIQFQQLIDLLGTSPAEARSELLDQAFVRLAALSAEIPAGDRAAALGAPGLRLRSPRLVAALVCAEPPVAVAAVRAAALTEEQWLDLIPALPASARGFLRARDDFGEAPRALMGRLGIGQAGLPAPDGAAVEPAEASPVESPAVVRLAEVPRKAPAPDGAEPVIPPAAPVSGIGAIVERIEAFRRARATATPEAAGPGTLADDLPQLPLGDSHLAPPPPLRSVDFATDAAGRVTWSGHETAPMLIGMNLAGFEALQPAIRQRQPIRATPLTLAGATAIEGAWQIDAFPRFDPQGGRFTGYVGRLRRLDQAPGATDADVPSAAAREADALRQVLHELRTPVNAIQGFAEIIQHQLYGPTPHEYRALSAVVVADAARILAGFEELDRLARLGSGTLALEEGTCDFAALASSMVARLVANARTHGVTATLTGDGAALPVAIAPIEAERLTWRLLSTLAGAAQAGDVLALTLNADQGRLEFRLPLPAALAALEDRELFNGDLAPAADLRPLAGAASPAGMFGTGFALRLARVEARAAGGSLIRDKEMLTLALPLLTRAAADHSDGSVQGRDRKGTPAG